MIIASRLRIRKRIHLISHPPGIKSVAARVKNLKNVDPDLSLEKLMSSVEVEFSTKIQNGLAEIEAEVAAGDVLLPEDPFLKNPEFETFHANMVDWGFRFGSTPNFSHSTDPIRLERSDGVSAWGMFEAHMQVTKGRYI
jgi:hypothetical protein